MKTAKRSAWQVSRTVYLRAASSLSASTGRALPETYPWGYAMKATGNFQKGFHSCARSRDAPQLCSDAEVPHSIPMHTAALFRRSSPVNPQNRLGIDFN
jgi:hypothetical protein